MLFLLYVCETASSDNLTRDYWKLTGAEVTHGYVCAAFLILFECIGLPWNFLVIFTVIKDKLFHQPTIILLLNLILTDIFLLVGPIPLILTTALAGEFILGSTDSARCKTCHMDIFMFTPTLVSLFTVALMSLDRFMYIYAPFKYERNSSKYITIVAVTTVILVSVSMGFAVQFTPGKSEFSPAFFICIRMYSAHVIPVIIAIIVVIIIAFIIIINCIFANIVRKKIKAVYSHGDFGDESHQKSRLHSLKKRIKSTRSKKQRRLCVMVSALIFSSLLVILPRLGLYLYTASLSSSSNSVRPIATIFLIMGFSLVVVRPVIETCLVPDIYKPMRKLITCQYFYRKDKYELNENKNINKPKCITCACIPKKENKFSFLITALKAAMLPKGVASNTENESPNNSVATKL